MLITDYILEKLSLSFLQQKLQHDESVTLKILTLHPEIP